MNHRTQLELNTLLDRQPMAVAQQRRYMVASRWTSNQKESGGADVEMFEILPRDWNLQPNFTPKLESVDMNWGRGGSTQTPDNSNPATTTIVGFIWIVCSPVALLPVCYLKETSGDVERGTMAAIQAWWPFPLREASPIHPIILL